MSKSLWDSLIPTCLHLLCNNFRKSAYHIPFFLLRFSHGEQYFLNPDADLFSSSHLSELIERFCQVAFVLESLNFAEYRCKLAMGVDVWNGDFTVKDLG